MEDTVESLFNITFYKTKFNTYLFKLSSNFGELLINDMLTINHSSYGEKEFELGYEPITLKKVNRLNRIDQYRNSSNDVLTVEEYDIELAKLSANKDEDDQFANIDEEYAYKKFRILWKPEYKVFVFNSPVSFNICDFIYSEYEEIKPLQSYGGALDNPTCICILDPVLTLKKICKDLNIPVIKHDAPRPDGYSFVVEIPDHSGIKYAKLNNNYIFSKESYSEGHTYRASYEECVTKLKIFRSDILNIVKATLKVEIDKKLSKSERREICSELTCVFDLLQSVEPTKRTSSAYYKAKENITKILKTLQGLS